jgi:prophage regulatory protein
MCDRSDKYLKQERSKRPLFGRQLTAIRPASPVDGQMDLIDDWLSPKAGASSEVALPKACLLTTPSGAAEFDPFCKAMLEQGSCVTQADPIRISAPLPGAEHCGAHNSEGVDRELSASPRESVQNVRRIRRAEKSKHGLPNGPTPTEVSSHKLETGAEPDLTDAPLYLGVRSVARRYDVSVASIWRWVAAGKFPRPYKIACGTTRWSVADLDAYDRRSS